MLIGADFCGDTANIWQLVGMIVYILKIVIPLILIILGMLDLGKAVVSSDEKAINKAVGTLVKRFIAAVVIFFVPTIVNGIFTVIGIIGGSSEDDYQKCVKCLTNPNGECSEYARTAKEKFGFDQT